MPPVREQAKPESWSEYRSRARPRWASLFFTLEWCWAWLAWGLNNWRFVEVLDRLGSFSVLVAVIFYFAETEKRTRQEHYQAWQVINTAQDKGGSGGRIEALEQLNADHVPLIGVDASDAVLLRVRLDGASLRRCNLSGADLRYSSFRKAVIEESHLHYANFCKADLSGADLKYSDLTQGYFAGSNLSSADLTGVDLSNADFRFTDLSDVKCERLAGAMQTNIYGVRNASKALLQMLKTAGAVSIKSSEECSAHD